MYAHRTEYFSGQLTAQVFPHEGITVIFGFSVQRVTLVNYEGIEVREHVLSF